MRKLLKKLNFEPAKPNQRGKAAAHIQRRSDRPKSRSVNDVDDLVVLGIDDGYLRTLDEEQMIFDLRDLFAD